MSSDPRPAPDLGPVSVSTHILDTSVGRPAAGVAVSLDVRKDGGDGAGSGGWTEHARSATDADGRCKDFPALPEGAAHVRLRFETEPYFASRGTAQRAGRTDESKKAEEQQDAPAYRDSGAFFPEVTIVFAVEPGEHYHVPLLLNPYGYSVYRGS